MIRALAERLARPKDAERQPALSERDVHSQLYDELPGENVRRIGKDGRRLPRRPAAPRGPASLRRIEA